MRRLAMRVLEKKMSMTTLTFLAFLKAVFVYLAITASCDAVQVVKEIKADKALTRGNSYHLLRYASFKQNPFSYLNITSLGAHLVEDSTDCGLTCLAATPSCFSYNLAAFPHINGKLLCELLPSDMYNNSQLVPSKGHHHFSIASQCSSQPCKNDGKCMSLYEENSYECVCKTGLVGKNCETKFSMVSTIVTNNFYLTHLAEFLAPAVGNDSKWQLCYRASTHGWRVSEFHTRCDGKRNTVTIIQVGQYIFGGYTDIPWDSSGSLGYTSNSFIFSLKNSEDLTPFKGVVAEPNIAIRRRARYGPGFGYTLEIVDQANSNKNSKAFIGEAYSRSLPNNIQNRGTILAGTKYFTPDDWEVFYVA